ncbi:protein TIC 100 [Lathyrus oleraceus]|uniref:Protein TIC 100 n=1 Tax=Pisum sativum TaxID=3888 RepID=A0A9D4X3G5_PEA|nr:protein TIC 100 [Pisum sativum]KAI5412380.1 hypothetical protein KIW84_057159 [Pisum sativum]
MFIIRRFQKPPPPTAEDPTANSDSDSSSSPDSDPLDEAEIEAYLNAYRIQKTEESAADSDSDSAANYKDTMEALQSAPAKKILERNARLAADNFNPFDFPPDNEDWREEDLRELWDSGNNAITGTGWDLNLTPPDDWTHVLTQLDDGKDLPIAPFYLPYRKPIPPIPNNNNISIKGPEGVIEEFDRIEEFLKWVSYVFEDGTTYEGTVWDDVAQGKGVYSTQDGFVRYEGEWVRNDPEGHGVVEVEIPAIEPVPGSGLEEDMRDEGKIIKRDFMSPQEREWLRKDIEDSYRLANGRHDTPYHERDAWVKEFGEKPEKGRYRYAGQWKHGKMHGCGVYEFNERIIYGRFYFGEILDDDEGCDDETSALHAGIAEVAAAKARMFVNKPDGMVREKRGPHNDPQHAYLYEGEDAWMAPGFINQFYEVPDDWKTYAHEVDQEREGWLNSFYKSPLRIPMPAELEYWWSKEENHELPEFILINNEPEPDPEDPSNQIYTEDPLILHTPTGNIINYVEDEKHGIRMFWQPPLKRDEKVDPEKAAFLPLGYVEFFGIDKEEKNIEKVSKPWYVKAREWAEAKKKTREMKKEAIEKQLELIEAEICMEEAIEDMEELLRRREKEEKMKSELGLSDEDDAVSVAKQDGKARVDVEEEDEEEDEDDIAPSSFGSIEPEQKTDQQKEKPGKPPFSSSSLAFASSSLISAVPSKLQQSFTFWNKVGPKPALVPLQRIDRTSEVASVSFPLVTGQKGRLNATGKTKEKVEARSYLGGKFLEVSSMSKTRSCYMASASSKSNSKEQRRSGNAWLHSAPERDLDSILSLNSISSVNNFYPDTQT